jgi:hypothetical protein
MHKLSARNYGGRMTKPWIRPQRPSRAHIGQSKRIAVTKTRKAGLPSVQPWKVNNRFVKEGSGSFLKKRTKKLLLLWDMGRGAASALGPE